MGKPVPLPPRVQAKNLLWASAALGAGASGAAVAIHGISALYNHAMEEHRYNKMLKINPELKRYRYSKEIFHTLNSLAPQLAKEPLVASTFVRQTLATDMGGGPAIDPLTMNRLSSGTRISQLTSQAVVGGLHKAIAPLEGDNSGGHRGGTTITWSGGWGGHAEGTP